MAENQDLSDLINALDAYQENQETLPSVVEAAFNLFGEDWTAVCICHETDHLDGVLYIDKTCVPPKGMAEDDE